MWRRRRRTRPGRRSSVRHRSGRSDRTCWCHHTSATDHRSAWPHRKWSRHGRSRRCNMSACYRKSAACYRSGIEDRSADRSRSVHSRRSMNLDRSRYHRMRSCQDRSIAPGKSWMRRRKPCRRKSMCRRTWLFPRMTPSRCKWDIPAWWAGGIRAVHRRCSARCRSRYRRRSRTHYRCSWERQSPSARRRLPAVDPDAVWRASPRSPPVSPGRWAPRTSRSRSSGCAGTVVMVVDRMRKTRWRQTRT